jgi:glycosyltransferase involved in cell wall biosynthesis
MSGRNSPSSKRPVISVCVICFNQERYIADCIEGILAQNLDANVEILIGDDASTDRTSAIIEGYAERDRRIVHICRPENLGFVANQRDLSSRARGEFVALCEGDDFWLDPDKLERQLALMNADPAITLCFTAGVKVSSTGDRQLGRIEVGGPSRELSLREIILEINGTVPTSSMLMRRSALMNLPDRTYDQSPIDYAMQVLVGAQGRIWYDSSVTTAYRIAEGSWSEGVANDPDKYLQHYQGLRGYRQFLEEQLPAECAPDLRRAFEPLVLGFYMSSRARPADKLRNLPKDMPFLSRRGRMIATILTRVPALAHVGAFARRRIWGPFLRPLFGR